MKIGRLLIDGKFLRLLWDLFMVWVAIINLSLILFDLTYLWVRPTYLQYVPIVTRIYDPVLGITPHPLTTTLMEQEGKAEQLFDLDPESARLEEELDALSRLTYRLLTEKPFDRSKQARSGIVIARTIALETGVSTADLHNPLVSLELSNVFWSGSTELLEHRFQVFDKQIKPLLAANYYREFDRFGNLTNHFWMIDAPFLLLFWVEFITRWIIALRRGLYARWFFFPIFNWYDLLGLIPMQAFRVFRLLRLVSMYMRLRRSKMSSIGRDYFSRTVAYFSNIITEEVSDRVALRILEEYAEEIRDGTHLRIIEATLGERRGEIEKVLVDHVRLLLTDTETLAHFQDLLRLNLDRAVDSSDALQAIPLPNAVLRPVVRGVGEVILQSTLQTITSTIESLEGQEALDRIARSIADNLLQSPVMDETTRLTEDISLQIIDHMREVVSVKKWALPEEEQNRRQLLMVATPWAKREAGEPDD